ncbi:hypothetical protein CEE37_11780 [candidate division LCP-89 bacterium B3_LCP]|uniref:Response regulatory domain-containing protein n=1 Tax=candidate division LCP-89 bacterium B3_LCP TaxID=2012998 RepID=A0A532UVY3_UNCL8|nr:MAG: hypothetical protein CEE37_11780 [candidate division LCP-89 bacterium B3_LCP]
MNRPALIVDDNDDYTSMLLNHLEPLGYNFDRAHSGREGWQKWKETDLTHYHLVVTDITMESQTAGLSLIRKLRKAGYKGLIMVASTGVNNPLVLQITKLFYKLIGVDILVPKEPLKSGEFRCVGLSGGGRKFVV